MCLCSSCRLRLPDLELEGEQVIETDEQGSAYIGDVSIVEGSGKVSREAQQPGCPPGAMDLQLCAELAESSNADPGCVLPMSMHYEMQHIAAFRQILTILRQCNAVISCMSVLHKQKCGDAGGLCTQLLYT